MATWAVTVATGASSSTRERKFDIIRQPAAVSGGGGEQRVLQWESQTPLTGNPYLSSILSLKESSERS